MQVAQEKSMTEGLEAKIFEEKAGRVFWGNIHSMRFGQGNKRKKSGHRERVEKCAENGIQAKCQSGEETGASERNRGGGEKGS